MGKQFSLALEIWEIPHLRSKPPHILRQTKISRCLDVRCTVGKHVDRRLVISSYVETRARPGARRSIRQSIHEQSGEYLPINTIGRVSNGFILIRKSCPTLQSAQGAVGYV